MKKKGIAWDWSKLAGWKSKLAAGTLGSVAGAKAWSSAGVEPEVANELSELGIANVGDLENLSGSERERIESHMKKKGIAWDWSKLAGWKSKLAAGSVAGAKDWTSAGVEPEVANELSDLGIANVGDLENLSGSERDRIESHMKKKGIAWDWSKLAGWKSKLAAGTLGSVAGVVAGAKDWSSAGVEPEVANELSELGIANVDELEDLSGSERERIESHMKKKGIAWDWSKLAGWKSKLAAGTLGSVAGSVGTGTAGSAAAVTNQAAGAAGLGSGSNESSWFASSPFSGQKSTGQQLTPEQWQSAGVDPKVAAELASLGIANPGQLEHVSDQQRAQIESHMSQQGVAWDWSKVANWKAAVAGGAVGAVASSLAAGVSTAAGGGSADANARHSDSGSAVNAPSIPVVVSLPPASGAAVDWKSLDGVDPVLAREFSSLGIANVQQIQDMDEDQRSKLNARLKQKGIKFDWAWLTSWKSAAAVMTGAATVTGFASAVDSEGAEKKSANGLPVFATGDPSVKDDLTLLDGIEGPQAIALHRMGIHNFGQLHEMSAEDRQRLQSWFRMRGWSLDMDQWRIASEGNTANPTIEDIQRKAFEIYQYRDREGLGGGERTDWEQSEWELRGNPSFGYGVPHDVDDFAVSVTGVTPEARDELYRMGLYNRHQVQDLSPHGRRLLTRWFAGPRFGIDLTSAFGWLSSLQSIPQNRNFGWVHPQRPETVDDLSLIEGVGPATERDLNRLGVYHFQQIQQWTEENIRAISETLDLGSRIHDDNWMEQAAQHRA